MDGRGHYQNQFAAFHGPYEIPAQTYYMKPYYYRFTLLKSVLPLISAVQQSKLHSKCQLLVCSFHFSQRLRTLVLYPEHGKCIRRSQDPSHNVLFRCGRDVPLRVISGLGTAEASAVLAGSMSGSRRLASWDAKSGMDKGHLLQLSDLIESLTSKNNQPNKNPTDPRNKTCIILQLSPTVIPTITEALAKIPARRPSPTLGQATAERSTGAKWSPRCCHWRRRWGPRHPPLLGPATAPVAWRDMERPNMAMEMT